jgi:hypothetical protein
LARGESVTLTRVHIRHPDIIQHGDVTVSLRPFKEMNAEAIVSALENYLQSDDSLIFDQSFEVAIGTIKNPAGGAKMKISSLEGADCSLALKKSVVQILNKDRLCMARALVVCRGYEEYKADIITRCQYKHICKSKRPRQRVLAEELQAQAGISTDRFCNMTDVDYFENVFSAGHGNKIIYSGSEEHERKYFLYMVQNEGAYIYKYISNYY